MSNGRAVAIEFFADFTCPWCYVGWEALKRAAIAHPDIPARLNWRGFLVAPDAPPEGIARTDDLSFPPALLSAAAAAGISLGDKRPAHLSNTVDAHRLVHWAAPHGLAEAVIDDVFAAYFVEHRDIGEATVLVQIGAALGLEADGLRRLLTSDVDVEEVLSAHDAIKAAGFSGVPVAIFNGDVVLLGAETPDAYGAALEKAAA